MKLPRFWFAAIMGAVLIMSVAACGGNNSAPPPAPTPGPATDQGAVTDRAVSLYQANCMGCHAADLSGQGSFPALANVGSRLSSDEIANIIRSGRNMMPAFAGRLSDEDIQVLSEWLAAQK